MLANIVTGIRLVMCGWFVWWLIQGNVMGAAMVFVVAWGLDALDGWLARRLKEETKFGYWFDKIVDRLLLIGGLVVALAMGKLPAYGIGIAMKDIILIPVITIKLFHGEYDFGMGKFGKVMTFAQGVSLLWLLIGWPGGVVVVGLVTLLGLVIGGRLLYQATYQ